MDSERLAEAGIDYEMGIKRFGNKTSVYEKFLQKFPEEPYFKQLLEAMNRGDLVKALRTANSLKSVAGTLSLDCFYELICQLAEALREKNLEEAQKMMPIVMDEYRFVIRVLEESFENQLLC